MSAAAIVAAVGAAAPVEVLGGGALADEVRALLTDRLHDGTTGGRPAAVVDTTGDADALAAALARVDHLGTVVVAGPAPRGPVALDLYADLHVRGLTVVGLPHSGA